MKKTKGLCKGLCKGFTLTELLVVLTILMIVTCIAAPLTMNILTESKLNADKLVAQEMQSAVSLWVQQDDALFEGVYYDLDPAEMQYFAKYAGTGQLPGVEYTNASQIRKAVISAMQVTMGQALIVDRTSWTVEPPKTATNYAYRYYYRTGRVVVIDTTAPEVSSEPAEQYYILLDRTGFDKIAVEGIPKVVDTEIEVDTVDFDVPTTRIRLLDENGELIGLDRGYSVDVTTGKLMSGVSGVTVPSVLIENLGTGVTQRVKYSVLVMEKAGVLLDEDGVYRLTFSGRESSETLTFLLVCCGSKAACVGVETDYVSDVEFESILGEIDTVKEVGVYTGSRYTLAELMNVWDTIVMADCEECPLLRKYIDIGRMIPCEVRTAEGVSETKALIEIYVADAYL